jgi:vitamin B12 transporter
MRPSLLPGKDGSPSTMKKYLIPTSLWCLSLGQLPFHSQESPVSPVDSQLPSIIVTATGFAYPAEGSAASVSVIERQEIERRQYHSLAEALRFQPGLHLADRGTPGSTTGLFLRGTKTEHTSVMMDGLPLPANMAGSFNLETIPLDNIERVEVFRGPASYLYGARGIGGVINLLTRSGRGLEVPESSIWMEGGSFSSGQGGIFSRGPLGSGDYSMQFHQKYTDGHRENGDFRSTGGAIKLGMDLGSDMRLELDLKGYESEAGVPGPVRGFGANDPDDRLVTEYYSIAPRWEWNVSPDMKQTLTWQASWFRQAARNFNYFGGNNRVQVNQHLLDYRWDLKPVPWWQITAGWQGRWSEYTRFNNDARAEDVAENEDDFGLFWQNQFEPWEGVSIGLGIRYDRTTDFGDHFSGRLGIAWRLPTTGTLAKASYGSAFAPPSPQDRQPAFYGNPLLDEPETSRGWEIGLEQPLFDDKVKIGVTWFRNDLENFIEYDPTTFTLLQVDEARLEGWEFFAQGNLSPQWAWNIDYTMLDAVNSSTDKRLVRRPRHGVNASLDWNPTEAFHVGLGVSWISGREDGFGAAQADVEDYTVARLLVSWKPSPDWEIFGRIENALDEKYEPVEGFPAPGFGCYGGVRFRF